ncbi:MAG: hypothetical protein WBD38_05220 [Candidatus Dormiibacterota bacterium]
MSPPAAAAPPACVNQSAAHHATVMVRHGDGRAFTACVGFSGDTIGGKELLTASGIEHGFSSDPNYGDTVCQVDNEPSSYPPDCLKQSSYWSIWISPCGGSWAFAHKGIDGIAFHDHEAEGFSFVPQAGGPPPPPADCPPAAPPPASAAADSGGSAGGGSSGANPGAGASARSAAGPATAGQPSPESSPDPSSTSPNPGEVALGGGASPAPSAGPLPALATNTSNLVGIGAAAATAIGLVALLVIQLLLPRLRR